MTLIVASPPFFFSLPEDVCYTALCCSLTSKKVTKKPATDPFFGQERHALSQNHFPHTSLAPCSPNFWGNENPVYHWEEQILGLWRLYLSYAHAGKAFLLILAPTMRILRKTNFSKHWLFATLFLYVTMHYVIVLQVFINYWHSPLGTNSCAQTTYRWNCEGDFGSFANLVKRAFLE